MSLKICQSLLRQRTTSLRLSTSSCRTGKRPNLKMTSLKDNPIFRQVLDNAELSTLADLFTKRGYELRFAGGPVRDILAGKVPKDLDFATTATPDEMKCMFKEEGIRVINALGEKHGTITARINDKENFEVTTLRIDKVTDGRRAEVEFTKNWELDANRRDLTINSMFLDLEGQLYDYFNGQNDLKQKKIRFVGDAEQRIQEDYLRILRYFRFYGRIADSPDEHEEDTLKCISENRKGLEKISGERIWMEWKKILEGNFGPELTLKMIELDLSIFIGLPENPNSEEFQKICFRSRDMGVTLHPITMITGLLENADEMMTLHNRLKLSGFERDLGLFIIDHRNLIPDDLSVQTISNAIQTLKFVIVDSKLSQADCRNWCVQLLLSKGRKEEARELLEWDLPRFPIKGQDLMDIGCPKGKIMTVVTNKLRKCWKESDFQMSREELLTKLMEVSQSSKADEIIEDSSWPKKRKRR